VDVALGAAAHNEGEAAINQLMAARARRIVIVADSSKLGQHAFARICPIDRVDTLITDSSADSELTAGFATAGIEIIRI
jgi:DeoR family transcriptional regulator, aga operon transcriptional repressor